MCKIWVRIAINKIEIKVNFKLSAMWHFLGFLYHTAPADEKLTPDDAQFVDVIHSGGLWIGTDEPVSKQNTLFLQIYFPLILFLLDYLFLTQILYCVTYFYNILQFHSP